MTVNCLTLDKISHNNNLIIGKIKDVLFSLSRNGNLQIHYFLSKYRTRMKLII